MKIGVYVGSFNPPHKGHEKIVNFLLKEKYVNKIIVIPTGNYWNKQNLINIEDRSYMLNFIFKNNNNITINNTLSKYEYTYEILNELKSENKKDDLYLIIGADNFVNFHKWKNVNIILKNYVIILPRNNINIANYISKYKEKNKFILTKNFKCEEVSSTIIRNYLLNGNLKNLENIINKNVLNYILNKRCYKC